MSRLDIPADRAPELVTAFRGRAHLVDQADGFIDLQVWQSGRDPARSSVAMRTITSTDVDHTHRRFTTRPARPMRPVTLVGASGLACVSVTTQLLITVLNQRPRWVRWSTG